METVLIIGGGITGLMAAYELQKWQQQHPGKFRIRLVEASSELGGKIATKHQSDFIIETGADSIVTRKAAHLAVFEELGLTGKFVFNETGKSYIYRNGQLKLIPSDTVFGIPAGVESLAKSQLISAEGKVAALKDLYTKNDTFTGDHSIGEFLEYFLGEELVAEQIKPVLSGVYSSNLSDLSINTTLPFLLDYKNKYGSIINGLEVHKEQFQADGKNKFFSFPGGLKTLIESLEKNLTEVEISKNCKVEQINKKTNGYKVFFHNGEICEAKNVVIAIPSSQAAKLFEERAIAEELASFKNKSMVSVYIGFQLASSELPMEGTGFITADNRSGVICNACTWTSRKWKHTSLNGNLLVRLFYKSSNPHFQELIAMNEDELLATALTDITQSIGLNAKPMTYEFTKWTNNMPAYEMDHKIKVTHLEKKFEQEYPGLFLAGCSYYGVGIPDCIDNGIAIAEKIKSFYQ
ncbi:protoporphyrinogen oxidase [Bacillus kwashiorkori]|uniref:protoporphyrinogen oxidase n=1 Tax=Bacillus kwashiorkori TaxID=1522318 RepID=UPI0007811B66|nr:protoporphyrinogen oxidase [Bacillus kwashiorkori]